MKKTKFISLLALATCAATLASCGDKARYKIGVLLPVEHAALRTCAEGFKEALVEAGLKEKTDFSFEIKNAGGSDADLVSMAKDLVSVKDMTFGLGTGASKNLLSAANEKSLTKPIFFSAVTDPVAAQLVESNENMTGFVCGSSDAQPIAEQLQLINKILPSANKLGVLYTSTEENSIVQKEQVKSLIQGRGIEFFEESVSGPAEISTAALALAEKVDAIYIPTDNNIAANMDSVKDAANSKGVLVVCGEEGMLKNGGHITISVDYKQLGKEAGKMAVEIIKDGKKPTDFPVKFMDSSTCSKVYSSANLPSSITLPSEITTTFTDISK